MTTIHDSHPSRDQLAALSEGRLTGEDVLAVESHVTTCEVCADTLGELGAGDQLLDRLRSAVVDDPDKTSMISMNRQAEEAILKFLEKTARAGALGRLGHYDVLECLGRGAFGIVLRAFDDSLQRVVAVKVLAPELAATSPARKRFLREARSAAQVRHQNVVQIYAVEEQPLPYLVMEHIPGETLQQRLNHCGPLEVAEVLRLGHEIARGLAAAHDRGLIHRDIKPGNILIEKGLEERVKISDFGLARAVDDASLTQSGIIAGTPMFMAPEQARGETTDQRADLFSLGSVLYTIVSGRPPFRASGTVAVLKRVCDDTPRPIQEIIPETPQWLCDIISKLHAKRPEDRFTSAREVADLLGHCLTELKQEKVPSVPNLGTGGRGQETGDRGQETGDRLQQEKVPANGGRQPPGSLAPQATPPVGLASESAVTTPSPAGRLASIRNRGLVIAAAALLVLLSGLTLTEATGVTKFAATIIRIAAGEGQIVIETDGAGVEVVIKDQQGTVLVDGATKREITFKAGEYNIEVTVTDSGGEQRFVTDQFTLTRNGKQIVDARWELAKAKPAVELADARKPESPSLPGGEGRGEGDPDRRAAEWVLSIGGSISIKENGQERPIEAVGDLPRGAFELTALDLRGLEMSNAGLVHFKDCKNLAQLYLQGYDVTDAGLAHFKDCKNLTHLYLANTKVSDTGLAHFKDCKNLTQLHLDNAQVSDPGLAHFKDCKNLTYLYLRCSQISDAGLAHFKDCKNLTSLSVYGSQISDPGLSNFKDCTKLTSLVLNRTQVSDAGLGHFKDCKNLTKLGLYFASVSDVGLAHFKDCKNVTTLSLFGTEVSDAGLGHFKDCKNLTWLSLDSSQMSDAGLAPFQDCKNLDHLYLSGSEISDAGLAHFKDCKNLTYLDLWCSQMSDAGLVHFKDCKNLTQLSLVGTQVSGAGLAHFKDCESLERLWLDGSQINDAGLAQIKECKNLGILELRGTQVSDAGLPDLAGLPSLEELFLTSTRISLRGHEQLKVAMPKCQITWSEANRTVAENVLALGGTVEIAPRDKPESHPIQVAANLPGDYFQVRRVSLAGVVKPLYYKLPEELSSLRFAEFDRLESLDLSGITALDYGFLVPIHGLEELSLAKSGLDDSTLAKLPKLPALKRLVLDGNEIRGTGLTHLSGQPELIDLSLNCPTLTDLFAKNLAELKQLKRLSLAGSGLSDAGIKHLAGLPNLEALDLRRTKATAAGVAELHKALPECKIEWYEGKK